MALMPLGPYRRITKKDAETFNRLCEYLRQKLTPKHTMKTITIEVYKYDELSPEAKRAARQWYTEGMQFDDSPTIDDAKQALALVGWEIEKVLWSGFGSQGDGACFAGTWHADKVQGDALRAYAPEDGRLHKIASDFETLAKLAPGGVYGVKHDGGRYYHDHCTDFFFEESEDMHFAGNVALEREAVNSARAAMKWVYRQLETAYDAEQEEDAVAHNIRANEYDFTAQGSRSTVLNS
jgi:hypothetical protein